MVIQRNNNGFLLESLVLEVLSNETDNVPGGLAEGRGPVDGDVAMAVLLGPIGAGGGPVLDATIAGRLHVAVVDASCTVSTGFLTRRLSTVVPR